jgi:hypothetical protein
MSSKPIIIVIIVVVLVGFLATILLLGDSGGDEFSIKSNDQLAKLVIPKDSLPDDVSVDDISVTRISNSQFDDESLIVYELEPDGLEFTDEILLEVQLDIDNDAMPIVFISTSTGIDLVNDTKTEVDLEVERQNVSIPLTHFSTVLISRANDPYKIKVSAPDCLVGKQVITNASFTLYKDNIMYPYLSPTIIVWKFLEPSVKIRGSWEHIYGGVSPIAVIHGKPHLTVVSVGQTVTFQDDTFKCIKPGPIKLGYELEIQINMKKIVYASEENYFAGNGTTLETIMYFHQTRYLSTPSKCRSEDIADYPQTDPEEWPSIDLLEDPVEPEVKLSYNWTMNSQGLRVHTNIFVDVAAWPGANVSVTLSNPTMLPTFERVILNESGQTRITFIVYPHGEYTAVVEIGEFSIEKKIWA